MFKHNYLLHIIFLSELQNFADGTVIFFKSIIHLRNSKKSDRKGHKTFLGGLHDDIFNYDADKPCAEFISLYV